MNAPFVADREPSPVEIEPRPCEWCGLTIDRHYMVDNGEGPEFFCDTSAADLLRQWEIDDPRDRWRWTGEDPPPAHVRNSTRPTPAARYSTPQATVDAFWHVATHEPATLKAWLARHPDDAPTLHKIWKAKRCR
jgi:hypothetical protein